jgi:hypothetical protein
MSDRISPQEGLVLLRTILNTEDLWHDLTKSDVGNDTNVAFQIIDLKLKRLYHSMIPLSPPDANAMLTRDKMHEILDANNALMREMIQYKVEKVRNNLPE